MYSAGHRIKSCVVFAQSQRNPVLEPEHEEEARGWMQINIPHVYSASIYHIRLIEMRHCRCCHEA